MLKQLLGLKDPAEDMMVEGKPFKEWLEELNNERIRRSAPSEGLTLKEKIQSEILAERWIPVFGGPQKERRLPVRGGRLISIDGIAKVPWPDDIQIECHTFMRDDEEVNYISVSADGPNGDGESWHHSQMEYLPDYPSRQTMLESAADIARLVYRITGHKPLVYIGDDPDEGNERARWCMGEVDSPPPGYGYDRFIKDYARRDRRRNPAKAL